MNFPFQALVRRSLRCAAIAGALAGCALGTAQAQAEFPSQPLRMVIPYVPGTGLDAVGRPLAEGLSQRLGQPVVVDNRGGANGALGMEYVAKAPPDGHTFVLALDAQYAINPNLYKSLPYDPLRDFAPILFLGSVPYVLITNVQSGIKSLPQLIEAARKAPGKLNYTSSGIGSGGHMAAALLESMAKINLVHIPNKNAALSLRDVAENDCQLVFVTYAASKALLDAGKLVALAVSGTKRMSVMPDVPTVAETLPGFQTGASYGLFTAAATPPKVVEKLHAELEQVYKSAAYQQRLAAIGFDPVGLGPQAFTEEIRSELAKWKKIVTERGITAN